MLPLGADIPPVKTLREARETSFHTSPAPPGKAIRWKMRPFASVTKNVPLN